ncbi:MAG: hypothetical protein ACRCZD_14570 [Phycicoccus sp.]
MTGRRIRLLYVAAIIVAAVASALLFGSGPADTGDLSDAQRPALAWVGVALTVVAAVPALVPG